MFHKATCTGYIVVTDLLAAVCVQGTAKPAQPVVEATNTVPAAERSKGHTKKQLLVNHMPSLTPCIACCATCTLHTCNACRKSCEDA